MSIIINVNNQKDQFDCITDILSKTLVCQMKVMTFKMTRLEVGGQRSKSSRTWRLYMGRTYRLIRTNTKTHSVGGTARGRCVHTSLQTPQENPFKYGLTDELIRFGFSKVKVTAASLKVLGLLNMMSKVCLVTWTQR